MLIGTWGRFGLLVLIDENDFWMVLLPTILIALGQPFYILMASRVASVWFGENERGTATAIGSVGLPLGTILGLYLGFFFIPEEIMIKEDWVDGKRYFVHYLFLQGVIASVAFGLAIIFMKEKPLTPPSIS